MTYFNAMQKLSYFTVRMTHYFTQENQNGIGVGRVTTRSSSTTPFSAKISVYYMHFHVKICEVKEEAVSGR